MEYRFLETTDENLIEASELPVEDGIALTVRTTGYSVGEDELVELFICDLDGKELFNQRVKPQNVETWEASAASGGLSPKDVEDCSELYQFEDEIIALFEKANLVVAEHVPFVLSMIEASWVSLPPCTSIDLSERFRASHCALDYPGEPATAANLDGIAAYYGIGDASADEQPVKDLAAEAATVVACYRAFVAENAREREAKGEEYWRRRDERLAEEAARNATVDKAAAMREKRLNQMNGLLWVSGAIIFIALAIQLYQNGADVGLMVVCGAIAVFNIIRAIANFRK